MPVCLGLLGVFEPQFLDVSKTKKSAFTKKKAKKVSGKLTVVHVVHATGLLLCSIQYLMRAL
jgi:hypothetical protein